MKKRRLKKKVKIIGIGIILLTIVIIVLIKLSILFNSYEYKLKKIGYNKEETSIILKLDEDKVDEIITLELNKDIPLLIETKYFMYKNMHNYLDYYNKNSSYNLRDVVEIINTNRNKDYYVDIKSSDITKGNLTLVNKYYALNKEYEPVELKSVNLQYAYANNKLIKEANDKYIELAKAAKKLNYNLIINSSYRDFESQEDIYKAKEKTMGIEKTDELVARPGHSEHQLGYAIDIDLYKTEYDKLENTDEYKWLLENAHKYGFILRYPKEKENITGYSFEPWHYRYVGNTIAEYIYKNKITYDEYYAYYIEK